MKGILHNLWIGFYFANKNSAKNLWYYLQGARVFGYRFKQRS